MGVLFFSSRSHTRWQSLQCRVALPRACTATWAPSLPSVAPLPTRASRSDRVLLQVLFPQSFPILLIPFSPRSTRLVQAVKARSLYACSTSPRRLVLPSSALRALVQGAS